MSIRTRMKEREEEDKEEDNSEEQNDEQEEVKYLEKKEQKINRIKKYMKNKGGKDETHKINKK